MRVHGVSDGDLPVRHTFFKVRDRRISALFDMMRCH